jgi:Predicted secreted protein
MNLASGLAIFFVIWWLSLFLVLPIGIRSQHETGTIEPGTEPGAPVRSHILRRLAMTTLLAGLFFTLFYAVVTSGMTLDDIPFFRPPSDR